MDNDIDIDIICTCGRGRLYIGITPDKYGMYHIIIPPCPHCIEDEREDAEQYAKEKDYE